ncbi:MAG TPA: hypothetical protein VG265_12625 [Gaiellaceae bacterium]|nr:hypothetical protein [Gaiellaceae bacterium]
MRRLIASCLAVGATFVVTIGCASGAGADRSRPSAADQAAAKRDVLHISDLPPTVPWTATKLDSPNPATPSSCTRLDYNSPSIVDTAQAGSQFKGPGMLVVNQVGLVADPGMIDVIWKHIYAQSISRCIGDAFSAGGAGHIKLLSSKRLPFPRLTRHLSAYRVLFQLTVKGMHVRGAFDMVVLGNERTLSMLMVMGIIGSASDEATGERDMTLIDLDLAEKIAGRAFSTASPAGTTA